MKPEAKVIPRKEERASYDMRLQYYDLVRKNIECCMLFSMEQPQLYLNAVNQFFILVSPFMESEEEQRTRALIRRAGQLYQAAGSMGRDAVSMQASSKYHFEANNILGDIQIRLMRILKEKGMIIPTSTEGELINDQRFLRESDLA